MKKRAEKNKKNNLPAYVSRYNHKPISAALQHLYYQESLSNSAPKYQVEAGIIKLDKIEELFYPNCFAPDYPGLAKRNAP